MLKSVVITLWLTAGGWAAASEAGLPVVRWLHGINDTCEGERRVMAFLFAGYDAKCIETTRGQITSFATQIQIACDFLEAEIETLKGGFTLVGMSQGGLIARGVLQKCNAGQYVRRLLTFGTPHQGVALIPGTGPSNPINHTVILLCYLGILRSFVGPCSYIRSTRYFSKYQRAHTVIADLNNEFHENQLYRQRISQLEVFMTARFSEDTMVQPKNSAIFGFYKDSSYKEYSEMEEEDIFRRDRLGLQALERSGRLWRCDMKGSHLWVPPADYLMFIGNFADTRKRTWEKFLPQLRERCRFKEAVIT